MSLIIVDSIICHCYSGKIRMCGKSTSSKSSIINYYIPMSEIKQIKKYGNGLVLQKDRLYFIKSVRKMIDNPCQQNKIPEIKCSENIIQFAVCDDRVIGVFEYYLMIWDDFDAPQSPISKKYVLNIFCPYPGYIYLQNIYDCVEKFDIDTCEIESFSTYLHALDIQLNSKNEEIILTYDCIYYPGSYKTLKEPGKILVLHNDNILYSEGKKIFLNSECVKEVEYKISALCQSDSITILYSTDFHIYPIDLRTLYKPLKLRRGEDLYFEFE